MDEKPSIPSERQLICHKYAWANTERWIMFVGTHDTKATSVCKQISEEMYTVVN